MPKLNFKPFAKTDLVIVGTLLMLALLVILDILWWMQNPAKDIAMPIDKELVSLGAIKVCQSDDPGNGPDNYIPGYDADYKTSLTRVQAEALIMKVAGDNGFRLKHAQPGDLPIPSQYIGNWYFDYTSRHTDNRPINLKFTLYNDGKRPYCLLHKNTRFNSDEFHTEVVLNVTLPEKI